MSNSSQTYEVTKTVRFGLFDFSQNLTKNGKYQRIADLCKNNQEINSQINKYTNRITEASNSREWHTQKEEALRYIQGLENVVKSLQDTVTKIHSIDKRRYGYSITFHVSTIKKSCGFGKSLFFDISSKNQQKYVSLSQLINEQNVENVKKYGYPHNGSTQWSAYNEYILNLCKDININLSQAEDLLSTENHEKRRLSEIYHKINGAVKNVTILENLYLKSIYFTGNLHKKVDNIYQDIQGIKHNLPKALDEIETFSEKIHDPKHGYEIGKATMHYRTLNKQFYRGHTVEEVSELLGENRDRNSAFDNPLAPFAAQIIQVLRYKKLNFNFNDTVVSKAQKVIQIVKNIKDIPQDQVTLWNICNALNNKNQTYDQFMTRDDVTFSDLGFKQKVHFGLTICVDKDVYTTGIFHEKACSLYSEVTGFLQTHSKGKWNDIYDRFVCYTKKIQRQEHPTYNAKERGKLKKPLLRDYELVNKDISAIRGSLGAYMRYLESSQIHMIHYFAVLGKDKQDTPFVICVDREHAEKLLQILEQIPEKEDEYIYKYDSLTSKSLRKLFDQLFSEQHPFFTYKKELAQKKEKSVDEVKFNDLQVKEVKRLFDQDIAVSESWKQKFPKFYEKLSECNDQKSILDSLDQQGFFFEKNPINCESLLTQWNTQYPNIPLIVASMDMNTNQNKASIHQEYFTRAINKMEKHKDIDAKINPEFLLYYTPKKDQYLQDRKITEKQGTISQEHLKDNHRYWRDQITIGMPIEIQTKYVKSKTRSCTRFIGIDRGEKKVATLCQLESDGENQYLVPITYYTESGEEKNTYFLDLAHFKVGRHQGTQKLIQKADTDYNLDMKKYEYITRFIKAIWVKDNRETIQSVLAEYPQDFTQVREFMEKISGTTVTENVIFNISGLKKYQDEILTDSFVCYTLDRLIKTYNNFDFSASEITNETIIQQRSIELDKVYLRDVLSSQIAGVIDFLFRQNDDDDIDTYCVLENLHNSSFSTMYTYDKQSNTRYINQDFVEATHNKLYQTGTYSKVEAALMNKLQVHNRHKQKYVNHFNFVNNLDDEQKNHSSLPLKHIQYQLKQNSKSKSIIKETFQEKTISVKENCTYGQIIFIDPYFTSVRCPKCNAVGKSNIDRSNRNNDSITCKNCKYSTQNISLPFEKVNVKNAFECISSGDENGAFFIALRGMLLS